MTMWFRRKPGDVASISEDEPAVLIGEGIPDWIRLPPELGGQQLRVRCSILAACHVCQSPEQRHLELEGVWIVVECTKCNQFHWYRRN